MAEQEIVDQITAHITELGKTDLYEAMVIPETEQQYMDFYSNFTKARVAVQYIDSQYNPGNSSGIGLQEERVRFRLTYESKKLRGDGGVYNLIEITKQALIGFRPSDADRMTVSKYGLLEFEQGAWQPYLEFECKTLNVQTWDDNTEPSLGDSIQGIGSIIDYGT